MIVPLLGTLALAAASLLRCPFLEPHAVSAPFALVSHWSTSHRLTGQLACKSLI